MRVLLDYSSVDYGKVGASHFSLNVGNSEDKIQVKFNYHGDRGPHARRGELELDKEAAEWLGHVLLAAVSVSGRNNSIAEFGEAGDSVS